MISNYIIFDGSCGFCNKFLMLIAINDKNNNFKFVSSLSDYGVNLLFKYQITGLEKSTIILIERNDKIYSKSMAIKKVILKIPFYKLFGNFISIFPVKFSDLVYDLISKNRKRIMKNSTCKIPNLEIRKKFIM